MFWTHRACKTNGVWFTALNNDLITVAFAAGSGDKTTFAHAMRTCARQMGWGLSEGRDRCGFNGINMQ